jgi:hypothetical protein
LIVLAHLAGRDPPGLLRLGATSASGPARPGPDWDILASARRRNLRSPSHERSIRLMVEQFIHFPVRAEMELHPEALKLVDDEGSVLVGTEFVGWLVPNCQRELSIVVLPGNNSRDSLAERAGAEPAEGGISAIAGWNAGEGEASSRSSQLRC